MGQGAIVSVLSVASGEQHHWWLPQGLDSPARLFDQLRCAAGESDDLATCLGERLEDLAGARRVATPCWSQVRDRYLVGLHGSPLPRVVLCGWHSPKPGAGWIRSFAPQEWPQRHQAPRNGDRAAERP